MFKVFISYPNEDKDDFVVESARRLRENGVERFSEITSEGKLMEKFDVLMYCC